jgi:hypothetical protein
MAVLTELLVPLFGVLINVAMILAPLHSVIRANRAKTLGGRFTLKLLCKI